MFPTVQAPSQARQEIASLGDQLDRESLADVTTVVSELVGLSVAHGASKPIEVLLTVNEGELEGTVRDDGPGPRAIARAKKRRDDSLVLRILDGLVEEWGTDASETRIWFRMVVQLV